MRCVIFLAAAAPLAGCAGPPTHTVGSTPAMVSVCQDPADPWQKVLDAAQEHCASHGKNAEVTARDGRCSRGPGTVLGHVTHFRCAAP